jgi:hypothetical protein
MFRRSSSLVTALGVFALLISAQLTKRDFGLCQCANRDQRVSFCSVNNTEDAVLITGLIHNVNANQVTLSTLSPFDNRPSLSPTTKTPVNSHGTHWCIISRASGSRTVRYFFHHFAHTVEEILPCWSWFRQTNSTDRCGFLLVSYGHKNKLRFNTTSDNSWQQQLVDAMGCQVRVVTPTPDMNLERLVNESTAVFRQIPLRLKQPRPGLIRYLDRPEDAHALRRLFVNETVDTYYADQLQIGMIQRPNGSERFITNFGDVFQAVRQALPRANIVATQFNYTNVREQAQWFATKHVIIGAHGAAMANSIFISPGTIVMQLYPPGYFWQSLDPLVEQSGGIALDYSSDEDPLLSWRRLDTKVYKKPLNRARANPIFVKDTNQVVGPILEALSDKVKLGI